jgi:hypothetical protein
LILRWYPESHKPQTMSVSVFVATTDKAVKEQRHAAALKVIEFFGETLPNLRLKVLLDSADWPAMKAHGEENRGAFHPVHESVYRGTGWPERLREELTTVDREAWRLVYKCEAAVYLHDSTCQQIDMLMMTLAHELQHFIQYARYRQVWAYNTLVTQLHKNTIAAWKLTVHDIPIEREARIVAKRVSEAILGPEATAAYIDSRISSGYNDRDIADWKWIKEIDTSPDNEYDCTIETRRLFQGLRPIRAELEEALTRLRGNSDFANLNLDDAFGSE